MMLTYLSHPVLVTFLVFKIRNPKLLRKALEPKGDRKAYQAYRAYRVRKMSSLVQKCIAKGTKFPKYVVDLSKAFLTDPTSM